MATDGEFVDCSNTDCKISGGRLGPGPEEIRQAVELCLTLLRLAGQENCPMRALLSASPSPKA